MPLETAFTEKIESPTEDDIELAMRRMAEEPEDFVILTATEGDGFIQAATDGDEINVQYRSPDAEKLFAVTELQSLDSAIALLHSYLRGDGDYLSVVEWREEEWYKRTSNWAGCFSVLLIGAATIIGVLCAT